MDCLNCELKQRQFYCNNCLKQHLLSYRIQLSHTTSERDVYVSSAQRALLSTVEQARLRRAALKETEERVSEIWDGLEALRRANEVARDRIKTLREALSTRRRILAMATTYSNNNPSSVSSSSSFSAGMGAGISIPHRPIIARAAVSSPMQPSPSSSRPVSSTQRATTTLPFPSTSPQSARGISSSPHTNRSVIPSSNSSSPYGFAPPGRLPTSSPDKELAHQIEDAGFQLSSLSDTIARARSGLVQELIEVFSVVEIGERPLLGGKMGIKGEWTIGGLVLPVLGDMRRYPPDHINAVLTHTLHFLSLLSFYLGIKLPFEVIWSRSSTPPSSSVIQMIGTITEIRSHGLLGVGTPWIGATRGSESGGWAKWSTKHPLHVSTLPPPAAPNHTSSDQARSRQPMSRISFRNPSYGISSKESLAESHIEEPKTALMSGSSFSTALSMLLYNVTYLAFTQAVDISLAQTGEVLGNLWAICCSPELGRRSHATHPLLPAPTPPTFTLDFAQLLQATATNPTRIRAQAKGRGGLAQNDREKDRIIEEEEGWDLMIDVPS